MAKALINPTPAEKAGRNMQRIRDLREIHIPKAQAKGNTERVASLQAELDRRLEEVRALKAELDAIDG
jgi:hypothetical protein